MTRADANMLAGAFARSFGLYPQDAAQLAANLEASQRAQRYGKPLLEAALAALIDQWGAKQGRPYLADWLQRAAELRPPAPPDPPPSVEEFRAAAERAGVTWREMLAGGEMPVREEREKAQAIEAKRRDYRMAAANDHEEAP